MSEMTIVCSDDYLCTYVNALYDVTVIRPEALRATRTNVHLWLIGEMSSDEIRANRIFAKRLDDAMSKEAPCVLFGGWRSFGAGGWKGTSLEARLGQPLEPDDARQGYGDLRCGADEGDRVLSSLRLGRSGGFNDVDWKEDEHVRLWAHLPDGHRRPALVVRETLAAIFSYVLPVGGRAPFFSSDFAIFLQWLVLRLANAELVMRGRRTRVRALLESRWSGNLTEADLGRALLTQSTLSAPSWAAKLKFLEQLAVSRGFWISAADAADRLGATEREDESRLKCEAAGERYRAFSEQERQDWGRAALHLERAAYVWDRIGDLHAPPPQSIAFAAFFRTLSLHARIVDCCLRQQWGEALKLAVQTKVSDTSSLRHGMDQLSVNTQAAIKALSEALRELDDTKWYHPISQTRRYLRVERRIRNEARTLRDDLSDISPTYPQFRRLKAIMPSEGLLNFRRLAKRDPELSESTMLVSTYALMLILIYSASYARPMRVRAAQALTAPVVIVLLGVAGLASIPLAVIALCWAVVGETWHWYSKRSARDALESWRR